MASPKVSAFDAVPDVYDRARPRYPDALFADLHEYAGGEPGGRVLEIGPMTGQATASLLAHGWKVTAVELGPNSAAYLARKFAGDWDLEVLNGAFEDVPLERRAYDFVVAATSFHWIEAGIRVLKSYAILRPGGVLAVIDTNQIASRADRGFFERCQPIYAKYGRGHEYQPPPGEDVVPPAFKELNESPLFEDVRLWRYRWDQTYTTERYIDLTRSYSVTEEMAPLPREAFLKDLAHFVDTEFGGQVTRPLVITLVAARKRGERGAGQAQAQTGSPVPEGVQGAALGRLATKPQRARTRE